jgi:hypothetical protein
MNDDSGKISGEICRQMGTCVFPLYHSVMAPPRGRGVLVAVGEGGALPNGTGFCVAAHRLRHCEGVEHRDSHPGTILAAAVSLR